MKLLLDKFENIINPTVAGMRILVETKVTTMAYDGLVQERRNSSALAMELRLSCINPSI